MHADPHRPSPEDDPAELMVRAGLVDVDYVEAQLGRSFATVEEAAAAVVDASDVSPHPLIEPGWLGRKRAWQRSGLHPVVWYLSHHRRRTRLAPHPLVESRQICVDTPEARFHPYGALSHWLSTAEDDTPLPTRMLPGEITWGAYRAAAVAGARAWRRSSAGKRPRLVSVPTQDTRPARPSGEDRPSVSVLMSSQDSAARLRPTVASLQAQTCADWELVVVDRGSTDDTRGVLRGLAAFEPRIRVVHADRVTVGAAFNTALAHAGGAHVAFIAAGREWTPGHLAGLLAQASAADAPMVHVGVGPVARSRKELLAGRPVDLATWLVRRDALDAVGGFDESLGGAVDRDLVLRLTATIDPLPVDLEIHRRPDLAPPAQADDWTSLVLERHLVDWDEVAVRTTVDELVSHVVLVGPEPRATIDWLEALPRTGVELVAVGVRLKRSVHILSHALGEVLPRVTFVPVAADVNTNAALNIGMSHAHGSTLVLARPEAMPPRDHVHGALVAALDAPDVAVAQPVVVGPDGTVVSAGARFAPTHTHPGLLLEGHPVADARRAGTRRVAAPASPLVALRTTTAVALRGLCCRFTGWLADTDLGLRAHALHGGQSVVVPEAVVTSSTGAGTPAELIDAMTSLATSELPVPEVDETDLLRAAGFEVTDRRSRRISTNPARLAAPAVLVPEPVVRSVSGIDESPPRLRWAIDIAAPAAMRGDRWGDTYFAASLAAALTRQGQDVTVDRREARHRDTRDHDDVLLVLRGLDRVNPRPGLLNMMWVISHPDMLTAGELAGYDAVYAASLTWSSHVSRVWGVPVTPLLQCTDSRWFHPGRAAPDTGPEVVFVGNSRGVYRFAVRTAIGAGLPLTLHGNDWQPFVPVHLVSSTVVANEDLGAVYGSAGVVLNDHHRDMRRDSFLSNRLFDAAACGSRVATDPVEGLDEIFGGLVQPFSDEAGLATLCTPPYDAFPDDEARQEVARRVVAEHSFDARARTLVDDAVRRLRARGR